MKKLINYPLALVCLFILTIFLSSFSVEYSREDGREDKLSKQEQRRQERFEKQKEKIAYKIDHAKNDNQKKALQKKLRSIQKKQDGGNPVFGVVGMCLAILAFIFLLVFAISSFMGLIFGGNPLGFVAFYLLIAALVSAFVGLGLSITGMVLQNKKPDVFSGRGFALVGIILGAIAFGIGLIALGVYFILL